MSEACELDWDGWLQQVAASEIPKVVAILDELSEADDCISRVLKTPNVIWCPEAQRVFYDTQQIMRNMRQKILALPTRKE